MRDLGAGGIARRDGACSRSCAICRVCCAWRARHAKTCSLRPNRDLFVGIDAPEFNLASGAPICARQASRRCNTSVRQVWAWRQSRVRSIHESVDLVLCLLPFEKSASTMRTAMPARVLSDIRSPMRSPMTVDRRKRPGASSRSIRAPRWSRCCREAGAAKWPELGAGFRGDGAPARGAAAAAGLHRADGERGGAGDFCAASSSATHRVLEVRLIDGQATIRVDRRRRVLWWLREPRVWRPRCASAPWWWSTVWER